MLGESVEVFPSVVRRVLSATLRWNVRSWLLSLPLVSALYIRLNPLLRDQLVTRDTVLLIDGFPRSANGFASYAWRILLGPDARMSSLTHATRNFHRAARFGVPAVLLVREPDAVVASVLAYEPSHTPAWCFGAYARFYRRVAAVRDHAVVIDFETATKDVPEMVRRVNARFGTDFSIEAAERVSAEEVLDQIDQRALEYADAGLLDPETVAARVSRPVSGRQHRDVSHDDPAWASQRNAAWLSYRELTAGS